MKDPINTLQELERNSKTPTDGCVPITKRTVEWRAAFTAQLADAPKFEGTWIQGNGLHHAHIILGRVALAHEDMHSATEHLLASVLGPMSPQLSSFGPDQTVAVALLARGERDAVLAYAEACKNRFGASLGLLGSLFRPPDGESPHLEVVRDRSIDDGQNQ